jgi:preprotein translocase subunit YajC
MEKLLAAAPTTAETGEMGMAALLVQFLPLILIVVVFYFMLIRPQRKRDKATQEMRAKIEVGDEIVTVGGVIGRVVSLKDDTIVIETGSDRSKVRIARWAIQTNNTIHDDTPS